MIGSLLVTFDEHIPNFGEGYYTVKVNGQETYRSYFGMTNLYSSKINIGDVVRVDIEGNSTYYETMTVYRRDYTTDDEAGDKGIKSTYITESSGYTGQYVQFTASTRNDAYDFEYRVGATIEDCLSIGDGFQRTIGTVATVRDIQLYNDKIYCLGRFEKYNGVLTTGFTIIDQAGFIDNTYPKNQFSNATGFGLYGLTFQSDGKMLIGGVFTAYSGITASSIVRLNTDFSIDTSFSGTATSSIKKIVVQPDNKILVVGDFQTLNGVTQYHFGRLNSDGTTDTSVSGNTVPSNQSFYVDIFADGKILFAGTFTNYRGYSNTRGLFRLNSDGSFDNSFINPIKDYGYCLKCKILSDGKILIAGQIPYNSITYGLMRLNNDGTIDETFELNASFFYCIDFELDNANNYIIALVYQQSIAQYQYRKFEYNGKIDNTFTTINITSGGDAVDAQDAIKIKDNGDVIFGSNFTSLNGLIYRGIAQCDKYGNLRMCNFNPPPPTTPTPTPTTTSTPQNTLTPTPTTSSTTTPTPTVTPTLTPTPSTAGISPSGKYILARNSTNIIYSIDSGTTFNNVLSGLFVDGEVSSNGQQIIVLSGYNTNGNVYKSVDAGSSWSVLSSAGTDTWKSIGMSSNGQYIGITKLLGTTFKYSTDYGNSFTTINKTGYKWYNNFVNKSDGTHYLVSESTNSYIQKMSATGTTLTDIGPVSSYGWREVIVSNNNQYILASNFTSTVDEDIKLSTNSGTTFTTLSFGQSITQSELAMSYDGQYMYITTEDNSGLLVRLFRSADYGTTFSPIYETGTQFGPVSLDCSSDGKIVTLINHIPTDTTVIFQSTDYGVTFTQIHSYMPYVESFIKVNK